MRIEPRTMEDVLERSRRRLPVDPEIVNALQALTSDDIQIVLDHIIVKKPRVPKKTVRQEQAIERLRLTKAFTDAKQFYVNRINAVAKKLETKVSIYWQLQEHGDYSPVIALRKREPWE